MKAAIEDALKVGQKRIYRGHLGRREEVHEEDRSGGPTAFFRSAATTPSSSVGALAARNPVGAAPTPATTATAPATIALATTAAAPSTDALQLATAAAVPTAKLTGYIGRVRGWGGANLPAGASLLPLSQHSIVMSLEAEASRCLAWRGATCLTRLRLRYHTHSEGTTMVSATVGLATL